MGYLAASVRRPALSSEQRLCLLHVGGTPNAWKSYPAVLVIHGLGAVDCTRALNKYNVARMALIVALFDRANEVHGHVPALLMMAKPSCQSDETEMMSVRIFPISPYGRRNGRRASNLSGSPTHDAA
jgi:hypothetical protein